MPKIATNWIINTEIGTIDTYDSTDSYDGSGTDSAFDSYDGLESGQSLITVKLPTTWSSGLKSPVTWSDGIILDKNITEWSET